MLKRDISRNNVLIAAAGGMVGSGWLFAPYISAQVAGSNALISWIIAAVFMLLIALPLCELGAMIPISGGMSNYPTFTHGREVGFIFAWIAWLSYVVMTPIEIQAILQYSSHFLPLLVKEDASGVTMLSDYGYMVAISIMLSVVVLNTFGIKLLAECNKYASIIKFLVPSIAILSFLYTAPSLQNVHIQFSGYSYWERIFSALSTAGVIFAFTGFQNGLILAGEVKNPQRNIPIAILGAVLIGFILYFMLQLAFIIAVPTHYLNHGWHHLSFPGDASPLVGLAILLGLGIVAKLLLFDAAFSPLGTTLVYTAATSRILYGMAVNEYLPAFLLKLNRNKIPYFTLYINFIVGILAFLPLPSWQKMVAFLSSASILSYAIGPICLLGLRKLRPNEPRPFKLSGSLMVSQAAFYICNLMLYWCGFAIIWKLYVAVIMGMLINRICQRKIQFRFNKSMVWFFSYLSILLVFSFVGAFGGMGWIAFPIDILLILPFSIVTLWFSQRCLIEEEQANFLPVFSSELP